MINQYVARFAEPEKNMVIMLDGINKMLEQNGRKIYPMRVSVYVRQIMDQRKQLPQNTNSVSVVGE